MKDWKELIDGAKQEHIESESELSFWVWFLLMLPWAVWIRIVGPFMNPGLK